MLKKLIVSNLALVRSAEITFDCGLNIISGETGSGKSILIDGLMLLLGGRYDKSLLRYGAKSGFVEGAFEGNVASYLTELGLEEDEILIIHRKFDDSGKNEIRVNGRQITLSMLKTLTSELIDIYGQNEYHSLTKKSEHLKILDHYCGDELSNALSLYRTKRNEYVEISAKVSDLGNERDRERTIDLLSYQINEIEEADVKDGEEEELKVKRRIAANAQRIAQSLSISYETLSGSTGVLDKLTETERNLQFMSGIDTKYEELCARINSARIELDDVAETINNELEAIDLNEDIDALERRLDIVRSIKRKYGAYTQMLTYLSEAKERLELLKDSDAVYERLVAEKKQKFTQMKTLAEQLSAIRKNHAFTMEKSVVNQLKDLGMSGSVFKIVFDENTDTADDDIYTSSGFDLLEFYLSPNAGQPPKPLIKIISGGEMSRFMLALKVISGELNGTQTMIFDEIDTGISGAVGQEVSKKLYEISVNKQVICVTHLPQIAAMADNHLFITKRVESGETLTEVFALDLDGRVKEVSRLSGGENISSTSGQNAQEMIKWCNSYKTKINKA